MKGMVFIWHNASEVSEVYRSFRDIFGGSKGDLQIKLHEPDEDDSLSITRDDMIPNAISRSNSVIMLLGGKEKAEEPDVVRLFESIAFSRRRIVISPVFLRPSAKKWWCQNIEIKIESLRDQCVDPIDIWSQDEPALLTGNETDSRCVRRVEELRRRIEAKVRELERTDSTICPPEWGRARDQQIIILSSVGPEYSELERELRNALISLPNPVVPIIWSDQWQAPSSQAASRGLFEKPVLLVRIVADTKYTPLTDIDFRRDIRSALGLCNIDFGRHWDAITKSLRLDWAPKVRKLPPSEDTSSTSTSSDTSNSSIVCAGINSAEAAAEIGRYLGIVKPAPPRVGYITIIQNPDRSKLVPNAEAFESNLKCELRNALRDALRDRVNPADPDLFSYHMSGYEVMIEKEIRSGRVPIILADDLASSAQRPDIVQVLKLWEARIRTATQKESKMTDIIRGAIIYFNADDYRELAQFPNEEIQSWFPLVVDDGGRIASSQLRAMTSAVTRAYPKPS
jgi:hypothetical protein